eukprot:symbB.v1.2.011331.t1/scaffold759.1/size164804/5
MNKHATNLLDSSRLFLWQKASFQPLLRLSRITCSILHAIRVVIMAEGEHGEWNEDRYQKRLLFARSCLFAPGD